MPRTSRKERRVHRHSRKRSKSRRRRSGRSSRDRRRSSSSSSRSRSRARYSSSSGSSSDCGSDSDCSICTHVSKHSKSQSKSRATTQKHDKGKDEQRNLRDEKHDCDPPAPLTQSFVVDLTDDVNNTPLSSAHNQQIRYQPTPSAPEEGQLLEQDEWTRPQSLVRPNHSLPRQPKSKPQHIAGIQTNAHLHIGIKQERGAKRSATSAFLISHSLEGLCCKFVEEELFLSDLIKLQESDIRDLCVVLGASGVDRVRLVSAVRLLPGSQLALATSKTTVVIVTSEEKSTVDIAEKHQLMLTKDAETLRTAFKIVDASSATCVKAVESQYKLELDRLLKKKEALMEEIKKKKRIRCAELRDILDTVESKRDSMRASIKQWHTVIGQDDTQARESVLCELSDECGASKAVSALDLKDLELRLKWNSADTGRSTISFKRSTSLQLSRPSACLFARGSVSTAPRVRPELEQKRDEVTCDVEETAKKTMGQDDCYDPIEDLQQDCRHYQRYTKQESKLIWDMYSNEHSIQAIAESCGRSLHAIKSKLAKMEKEKNSCEAIY